MTERFVPGPTDPHAQTRPWTIRQRQILWHPESPGLTVVVSRYLPWFRRSEFASLGEVLRMYRARNRTR